jgi:protein involved in polysaccharide export with SLBB domain
LTNTEGIHRVPYYFYPGETAGSAAARLREIFTELSDLTQAYILRDAERLPLNLELPVFRNDSAGDIHLRGGDVIVIPFRRFYTILGEVAETGSRSITALTRLSALLTDLSAKASTRLAIVSSPGGPEKIYDLFLSRRFGDLSQDPYIRPGDTIRVPAAGRRVSIQGEVFRPGEYELLPGEGLRELVEYYADGFTLAADPEGLDLTRISVSPGQVGEARHISYREQVDFALEDRDQVTVRNKIEKRPRIFFEGALYAAITGDVETTSAGIEGTTLVEYPFFSGETLGNAAYNLRDRFGAVSDLRKAYMIRGQEHIPVDMYQFVYHRDFSKDMVLENGDTIIIPFQQYFVLVSGAVIAPGRYPYVPDRMAEYYINLAGGRDDLLNTGGGIKISDMNNQRLDPGNFIKPETIIEVPTNRLSARINQYAPVISIVLTLISTTLSIFAIMGIFN